MNIEAGTRLGWMPRPPMTAAAAALNRPPISTSCKSRCGLQAESRQSGMRTKPNCVNIVYVRPSIVAGRRRNDQV